MKPLTPTQLHQMATRRGVDPGFVPAPAKAKRPRSREESQMQCALMKWWHLQCRQFGVPELLLFSIPNGGGRSGPIIGSILKAEGLRKGAPDLFLAVPIWKGVDIMVYGSSHIPCHGLFLELKRREGVVSPEQEVFHSLLQKQGYKVVVVRSLAEAINQITLYLTT